MPDLRERLRAIESTPPPDLWTAIEARALEERPEPGTGIVAFEPRRPEWARRLATVAVAAAVSVLAGILVWRAFAPTPTPPIVPKPLDVPAGWERCENAVLGYSIGHPSELFTTDILNGEQDPSFACRWFSTEPFGPDGNLVADGYGYPLEVGYRTQGLDIVVADQTNDQSVRVLSTETISVAGHRAVRLEVEFTNSVLIAPGTVLYEYAIELMPDRTLVVLTVDQQGIPGTYQENRRVVDLAVSVLRFADPLPGALPAGWQRCTNVERAFDVGFPSDWYTTDVFFGERRQADACTYFASVPFELQTETGEPFGVAAEEGCGYPICIRFVPVSLDQLVEELIDPQRIQVISRSDETINGRRAVALDRVVLEPTLGEQAGPSYQYLIELGGRRTLLLTTEGWDNTVGDGIRTQDVLRAADFEANRAVLDQLVRTIGLSR